MEFDFWKCAGALSASMSTTILQKMVRHLFKDGNILGQVISIGNTCDFKVTGVFRGFPE